MKNHRLNIKKIIALPFLVTALFFSFSAQKAEAISVPTWDLPHLLETISQQLADNAAELMQEAMRVSVDQLAYAAGQALLKQVTDNTVSWIRGGFNGSPSFDINPEKLLLDLADTVAGNTARQIRGIATCEFNPTFNNDLANMLELSTRTNANAKFTEKATCPFPALNFSASGFYSAGVNSFQQNGGWEAMEAALEDAGNPFGMRVIASKELMDRQDAAKETQEKKLERSSGFMDILDTSDCDYSEVGGQAAFDAMDWTNDPQGKAINQRMFCKTKTPGKIAGDQLTKALGVDMDKLGFIDSINKILGALINTLTQQAVTSLF